MATTYTPVTRTVDIEEIYKAIEQDGFDWVRGTWLHFDEDGKVISACVLGGAAINLGILPTDSHLKINTEGYDYSKDGYRQEVEDYYWEVRENLSHRNQDLYTQLNALGSVPKDSKWATSDGDEYGIADAIIHWNDTSDYDTGEYVLKTYEEVTRMAYDILEPYFGTKITLLTMEQPPLFLNDPDKSDSNENVQKD